MAFFSAIAAVAGAIPIFDKWLQQFIAWYVQNKIATMIKENAEAIRKAVQEQDQRELEKTMGSSTAGEPSSLPGTEVRDSLPGVK
jgi:hypothetical protein